MSMRILGLITISVSFCLFPTLVNGQLARSETPTSVMDSYGNARPARENRRRMGNFSNSVQRRVLGGYQNIGRRLDRRGGFANYSVSGDVLNGGQLYRGGRFPAGQLGRFTLAPSSATATRYAFNRYGGFANRAATDPTRIGDLLARRQQLIAATTTNAPVHRALGQRGTFDPGLMSLGSMPFVPTETQLSMDHAQPIASFLQDSTSSQTARLLDEGWAWFADKRFNVAYRSFESTLIVDPNNPQAEVGRVFCRLSQGSMRSAMMEVVFLARKSGNPFAHAFNVTEKYHSSEFISQLLFQTRLFAERNEAVAVPGALYVYIQWYVGKQKEAKRMARVLADRYPQSSFHDWPEQMQSFSVLNHETKID